MKITYTPNPLETRIELDEHEKRDLWHKIRFDEMEELLSEVHHILTNLEWFNKSIKPRSLEEAVVEVVKVSDPEYYCTDGKSKLDERCDMLLATYIEELEGGHMGDCTAFPSSCLKCHAEDKIGTSTTAGLDKSAGHSIYSAFNYREDGVWRTRTLAQALEHLRTYQPRVAGYEAYEEKWDATAKRAYAWLLNYSATHFPRGEL